MFDILPPELCHEILSYLSSFKLVCLTEVSKLWRDQVTAYCITIGIRRIFPTPCTIEKQSTIPVDRFKYFCWAAYWTRKPKLPCGDPAQFQSRWTNVTSTYVVDYVIARDANRTAKVELFYYGGYCLKYSQTDDYDDFDFSGPTAEPDMFELNLRDIFQQQIQHDRSCSDCAFASKFAVQRVYPEKYLIACMRTPTRQSTGSCSFTDRVFAFCLDYSSESGEVHVVKYEDFTEVYRNSIEAGINNTVIQEDTMVSGISNTVTHEDMVASGINNTVTQEDMVVSGIINTVTQEDMMVSGINNTVTQEDMVVSADMPVQAVTFARNLHETLLPVHCGQYTLIIKQYSHSSDSFGLEFTITNFETGMAVFDGKTPMHRRDWWEAIGIHDLIHVASGSDRHPASAADHVSSFESVTLTYSLYSFYTDSSRGYESTRPPHTPVVWKADLCIMVPKSTPSSPRFNFFPAAIELYPKLPQIPFNRIETYRQSLEPSRRILCTDAVHDNEDLDASEETVFYYRRTASYFEALPKSNRIRGYQDSYPRIGQRSGADEEQWPVTYLVEREKTEWSEVEDFDERYHSNLQKDLMGVSDNFVRYRRRAWWL
ncbi:hypothetical protein BJ508DRAFT_303105 [Ascobolus immersus RN42]|uniref:F-box domain-containing protein n=1 Tax=Ascobolus immersus RN42 TaxID=1160509 RepID=A0A3N4ILJ5_ASCIM|nr:hypothetical protein BJ508DRAFT_303105 [Ascobolus immersus RN42]